LRCLGIDDSRRPSAIRRRSGSDAIWYGRPAPRTPAVSSWYRPGS